jgi:hypothetical protein
LISTTTVFPTSGKKFNSGELFTHFDPQADPDGDDWTNAEEATAGTNPRDSHTPAGILNPVNILRPESWADSNGDGILEHTPRAMTLKWDTIHGKQYTVLRSPNLAEESWAPYGESFIGNGSEVEIAIPISPPSGGTPSNDFWRISVTDIDSDADGLASAEEHLLGSNPAARDTDSDGINDFEEHRSGTSPTVPRIWAFKETRNANGTVTFTWNSYAANGDWFKIEKKQTNGTWRLIYETTYGSAKLPFVTGSHTYSMTLSPATDYLP